MGSKGSKTKEKKRKDGHPLRSENKSSTEPKHQSFRCGIKGKNVDYNTIKRANEETAKGNCSIASCDGKVSNGDLDAGFHTNSHRHSASAAVCHSENSSDQHLKRDLPPLPVVSEKECLAHPVVLPEQNSPSTVDGVASGPFILPNEPIISLHNGVEVVDSPVQAIKEGSTIQKRDSVRSSLEGKYENDELREINEEPVYSESKISEFCTENRPSTSTGTRKISDGDLTYMCIDTVQPTDGPVNSGSDLMGDKTERNLTGSEYRIIQDGNAIGITEKVAQNLTGVKNLELENWNKENVAHDDPSSYAEACMMQNELPKKGYTRLAVKPASATLPGHNQTAVRLSALRTQNGGRTDVERLNFPNAAAQVPRFPSQNSSSCSLWLSDSTIKHMRIFILMKAECGSSATCTVSLCVLIGLAGPSTITKCLVDRIQKHEKNDFKEVDSFEVPLLNCNHSSVFTVKVSNIEWLPYVDVVAKNINSEVFEMDRFMNDSVIDPLFWEHLQLPKGLLKEQKFAATISIQQENCPEKSFKILESLHKVSDLPSVDVVRISQMGEDSVENRRAYGFVKQPNVSRLLIASSCEIDLHSDGSAPDNNVLPAKIREKTKQLEHFAEPEPCALYFPN